MTLTRSAPRRIIGALGALAIALGTMTATAAPARADGGDMAKVLAGVAAIAIIGSALNDKGHAKPAPVWHNPGPPPRHGWHHPQPPRPPVVHHKPRPHYHAPQPPRPHYQPPGKHHAQMHRPHHHGAARGNPAYDPR